MTKKVWNMSKIKISYGAVSYPDKEKAFAIVTEAGIPFVNATVGITNPSPDYQISRSKDTPVNVFEYVLDGEGELYLEGKWKRVSGGDIYILRQGEAHRYRSNPRDPWKKLWINYVADYISPLLDAYGIKSGVYSAKDARTYFEQALEYASGGAPYTNVSYNIAQCVYNIINTVALESSSENSDRYRIREALNGSVYEKADLDVISERLHISKSNIIRIFKKSYGVTPYEYLVSLKIATAKILLKDTQMTIKEIAEKLCFSDEHYFSNVFLRRTGSRPREYRRSHNVNIN